MAPQALQQNIELTVEGAASLKGCSPQYLRKLIAEGKLPAVQRLNERNRPCYYIPLAGLPAPLQRRYLTGNVKGSKALALPEKQKPLERYTLPEQERIRFWMQLLDEWHGHRWGGQELSKAELDE